MTEQQTDELYMRRCLQLAAAGYGQVSPNPMVGAVVVCGGRIIGEGFHRQYGGAHAEVNAIASVADRELLARSTLYVSLEPCSHYGKTPPCSRLIIESRIPRVVVGCRDPFPEVSGRGIALLQAAGIEVKTGVLEEECRALNIAFMTAHTQHRPYVVLKWAQSRDGFIDRCRREEEKPQCFSDALTHQWAHRLRAGSDAILVGARTIRCDNPSLTLRYWAGRRSPLRVVLARHAITPADARVFTDGLSTLVFSPESGHPTGTVKYIATDSAAPLLPQVLDRLYKEGVDTLLVEGGTFTLQHFIDAGLWDEARVETAPLDLHSGVPAPTLSNAEKQFVQMFGEHRISGFVRRK